MKIEEVSPSNMDILYELNLNLAIEEGQKELFVAEKNSYRELFLSENPTAFGILFFENDEPIGFYVYFYKIASYLGKRVFYIEDIYLKKEYKNAKNITFILNHAIENSKNKKCCRTEMRVLKAFNLGYDIIKNSGFTKIEKWDVFRLE